MSVKLDALQPSDTERGEAVVVLQAAELALDGGAATVETFPFGRAVRDRGERDRASLAQRDNGDAVALARFVHDPVVVVPLSIAHVSGWNPRSRAASNRGATNNDTFRRAVSTCHASGRPVRVRASRCSL